jgi:hypothetical protein
MDNEQAAETEKKPLTLKDICLGVFGVFIILAIFALPIMFLMNFLLPVFGVDRQIDYQHSLAFAVLLFCMGRCFSPAK